jgi:phosphatidylglycerophosphate synthase
MVIKTHTHEHKEIVTTGSPQILTSWLVLHRNRTYGGFVDAVCDKAYVIPCWISLLRTVSSSSSSSTVRWIQYFVLLFLILAEVASGCIRFRAYFGSVAVPSPKVEGFDFSTSAVQADHVGKAKQTFEMVGTALFVLPWMRYIGLCFLSLAVPLAYESVRRKVHDRVVYVNGTDHSNKFDYRTLKFWMQAKAMGSKLIVGFVDKKTDMILNACSCSCVDEVVAEAPEKLDLMFLEKHNIHYVMISTTTTAAAGGGMMPPQFVTDEVVNSGRCLQVGDDGIVRQYKVKDTIKKE